MTRVHKRPTARADLVEIWQYIAEDHPRNADQFLGKIEETLFLLAEKPKMGRKREKIRPQLRCFPIGSYVIYYRPLEEAAGVEVVRVLHGAQDVQESRFE